MLDPVVIRNMLNNITPDGTVLPDNAQELITMAKDLGLVAEEGVDKMENLEDFADTTIDLADQGKELDIPIAASVKPFNLSKIAQGMGEMGGMDSYLTQPQIEETPEVQQVEQMEELTQEDQLMPPFNTGSEFAVYLENVGSDPSTINSVKQSILQSIKDPDKESMVSDALDDYFSPEIETGSSERIALDIFDQLDSPEWKTTNMSQEGEIMADYTEAITDADKLIQKLAKKHSQNIKKSSTEPFNMQKFAQHNTRNEVILYGPNESKLDPFSRQPVSDWAVVERNKGFGLVVDDVWNIDFEAIWRENIMDKYSRPYRDSDTGEWIGGYIQKRFEVDKNIPEQNNLQLKPGQKRKPYLPEYGLTEARLQDARSKKEIEGGPFIDQTKPFNWKEAQSKKKN